MRAILYLFTSLCVIGLAFWAYRENYATQQALSEAERLHRSIQSAHARLAVLKAEWAYQNRPERLRDLAAWHFDRLELLAMQPEQFGQIDQIAYPPRELPPITNPIEVRSNDAPEDRP